MTEPVAYVAESDVDALTAFGLPDEVIADFRANQKDTRLVRSLISLRQKAGLTQQALAEKVGWEVSQVERIENNQDWRLKISRAQMYLGALDYTLDVKIKRKG